MQKVFESLSSAVRRQMLSHLGKGSMTAGEIASRFEISKPAVSQHLTILETAGLVAREKRGQFVHYELVPESLTNALTRYMQEVAPVSDPWKIETVTPTEGKKAKKKKSKKAKAAAVSAS